MRAEFRNQLIDLLIQIGTFFDRTGNDQWCPRLINKNRVDFVDDAEIQLALNFIAKRKGEIVAQIIKTQFIVGRVGNVGVVGSTFFVLRLSGFRYTDCQPKEFVDRPHPVGITLREVFVNRDNMYTIATQCVEIRRQRGNQRLALAGTHFSDVALVQHHAANELHVERSQTQCAPGRFTGNREGLRQDVVKGLSCLQAPTKIICFLCQLLVTQSLYLLLKAVHTCDGFRKLAQHPLVAAAENFGQKISHSGLLKQRVVQHHRLANKVRYSTD